jgi:hypothetical protein
MQSPVVMTALLTEGGMLKKERLPMVAAFLTLSED